MVNQEKIDALSIPPNISIRDALEIIDKGSLRVAFIVENSKMIGIVTDGDIRRGILKGIPMENPVENIMTKNPLVVKSSVPENEIIKLMLKYAIFVIPILNDYKQIVEIKSLPELIESLVEIESKYEVLKKGSGNKLEFPKILVIGGAGFIGSILSMHLASKGYFVRILDIFYHGKESLGKISQFENIEIVEGDMTKAEILDAAMEGIDVVVHLGAIVGDPACNSNPDLAIESNLIATQQILKGCKKAGIQNFIFASTCSVYGASSTDDALDENSPLNPVSIYAKTKIDSEKIIMSEKDETFHPIILRFATAFGVSPRMRFDLAINIMAAHCVFNGKLNIFSGNQWRPFIHIRDIAGIIEKIVEIGNGNLKYSVYNCGFDDENYLIKDLVPIFQEVFTDIDVNIDAGKEDERTYRVSFERIKKELYPILSNPIRIGVEELKKYLEEKKKNQPDFNFTDRGFSNFKMVNFGGLQKMHFLEE